MFPIIAIAGSGYARGMQYGRQAAGQIGRSVASYVRLFAYYGLSWAEACASARRFAAVIGAFDAELLEEIDGIAAGSGRAPEEILALNVRTELLPPGFPGPPSRRAAEAAARNRAAGLPEQGECTAVAVLPEASLDGHTWLAQNWDWTGDQRAACVLLHVRAPGRPDALTLTEAGMLAKIGLNSAGLGVCLNMLRSRTDGQRPGVPVHVLLRALLGTADLPEAVALVRQAEAGASSNLLCADRSGCAASIEVTPGTVGLLAPAGGLLIHTNHCLDPATAALATPLDPISGTLPRYARAEALLRGQIGRIDRAALAALLRDEHGGPQAICRRPDPHLPPPARAESVAGVIMDLDAQTLDIAPGLPADVAFERVGLR
ncbi:MAG TPA: C45 family peptidase [Roseiflexaceae bacterium]|nr:C45 family peptidase [Roseiflexaceae bacterium]